MCLSKPKAPQMPEVPKAVPLPTITETRAADPTSLLIGTDSEPSTTQVVDSTRKGLKAMRINRNDKSDWFALGVQKG